MSETLVIRLAEGLSPEWIVVNDDGQVVVPRVAGELPQATAMSTGRRVVVIVPAGATLNTESDAPAKSASKLAQVVPYALEERVADELENLHFAIGERRGSSGRVPVVVVERARIDGWLAELRAAGLNASAIYSEASLVPSMPGQLIALLDGDTLTLRSADAPPLVLPALSIADSFEMALAAQQSVVAGLEPAPLGLLIYAGHDEWQARQNEIDAWRERFTSVKVQLLPAGPIDVLAPAAVNGEAVNLLQGSLAVASPLTQGFRAWRYAAALAGALLLLHFGGRYTELSRLAKSEAQLDSSIADAFRAAMPGQQNATDARRRVERRLAELQSGGGGGALLPALAAISSARSASQNATIEGFTFREGTVDLRILAPDAASLDAIGQQLRSGGWQADIMGGSASANGYRGRLQVRRAAS